MNECHEMPDHEDLALRLMEGEQSRILAEELFIAYGDSVIAALRKKYDGVQTDIIYDAVSQALLNVLEKGSTFDDEKRPSLRAWFFKIADNVILGVLRGRKSFGTFEQDSPELWPDVAPGAINQEVVEVLEEAVSQLPPKQKAVFKKHLVAKGIFHAGKCADLNGMSRNTFDVNLHHAKNAVRQYFVKRNITLEDLFN